MSGDVLVTRRSLVKGKSVDIQRSHGFFVYVRDRLVNQTDELFGLHALSHSTFNFFRADLNADDLHSEITAPREGLELGKKRELISGILLALFYEARDRKNAKEDEIDESEKRKREHERQYVPVRLVDQPIADTVAMFSSDDTGTDADEGWFFLDSNVDGDLESIIEKIYEGGPRKYRYTYDRLGKTERLVKLDPSNAEFTLNDDHEVIVAYSDDPRARLLLEDLVAAEVLLEVYLREAGIEPYVIGEVLERRDTLMRSLARDQVFSIDAIARSIEDSSDDEYDLEIALVAAARTFGFNAKHIGGKGEPDGVARFNDYKSGERKITLEAKSSSATPTLGTLDFAGLAEHVKRYDAQGCLLLAPKYPGEEGKGGPAGQTEGTSAVEERAAINNISCWVIEDLVAVIRATESHQISAAQVLNIVVSKYTPKDVRKAVADLLTSENMQEYYREIVITLRALDAPDKLKRNNRTVQHIAGILSVNSDIENVTDERVRVALTQMSNASKGMIRINRDSIIFSGDIEEFERRVANLTGEPGVPRKLGSFRDESIK